MKARLDSIQVCPGHRQPMVRASAVEVQAGKGLAGDSHARPGSRRQVLLADREVLNRLGLDPGTIKENFTVSGLDVMSLTPGSLLRIGSEVVLEITAVCEPCFRMDEIRTGLRAELEGCRGMTALVITGGRVGVGDEVAVQPLVSAS